VRSRREERAERAALGGDTNGEGMLSKGKRGAAPSGRRGIALVPTMLILSGLAVFTMAMMSTVLSGSRNVARQADDYQLSSSVESVATLAVEALWSDYLASQGGAFAALPCEITIALTGTARR